MSRFEQRINTAIFHRQTITRQPWLPVTQTMT